MTVPLITPLVRYSRIFFRYAGNKILLLGLVILMGGIGDSIGLSLLLPILDFERGAEARNVYTGAVYQFLETLGLGVSLLALLGLLFAAFLFKGILVFVQNATSMGITTGLIRSLRLQYCRKYLKMSYQYYINANIGHLNNLITTEIQRAVHGLGKFIDLMVNMIYILLYTSVAFFLSWKMTLVVLVTCSLVFAAFRVLARLARRLSILVSEKNSQIQSLLIQMIYNFKYLKATNSFQKIVHQLETQIKKHRVYSFKSSIIPFVPHAMTEPIAVLLLSGLILYFVSFQGRPLSEILVLLIFFYKAFTRVFSLQVAWQKFNATIGGVEVLEEMETILEQNKEADVPGLTVVEDLREGFEFKDVDFRYGDKQVLCDINLRIPKNGMVGVVGESGSGKTTLFDLLTGLLPPYRGHVFLDGKPYSELDLGSLRSLIGYVTQDSVLFNDTVANNICLWQGDFSEPSVRERIERAACLANCAKFIELTEQGYNTPIGDKGVRLSGGQRQRIAIARELFKEPQLLIFDEATSALDTESEELIQRSIESLMGQRTMVIAAHRLSTIRKCDQILVLSEGRVVEKGSFRDLYQAGTAFKRMCDKQTFREEA